MSDEEKKILYAKWLGNDLSEEEKNHFESTKDAKTLQHIVAEMDTWVSENPDVDYKAFKEKLSNRKKTKVVPMYRTFMVAASVLILLSVIFAIYKMKFSTTDYYTSAGETKEIQLPDGTKTMLNGNSSLSFVESGWESDRIVEISGQVYFDVLKKGPFQVKYEGGNVLVLGTRFDILTSPEFTSVKCYEGKVKVVIAGKENTLTAGQGVDSDRPVYPHADKSVSWNSDFTKFTNAPLIEVIKTLELKYGYTFQYDQDAIDKSFTGRISNTNSELALKMVFDTYNMEYERTGSTVILK